MIIIIMIQDNKNNSETKKLLRIKMLLGKSQGINESANFRKILGRKQNHTDSLCRKPFFVDGSLGRKQQITDSLGGSQIRRTVSAGSEN